MHRIFFEVQLLLAEVDSVLKVLHRTHFVIDQIEFEVHFYHLKYHRFQRLSCRSHF